MRPMTRTIPRWIRMGVFLLTLSCAVGSLIHATMAFGTADWGKAVFIANMAAVVFLPVLVTEVHAYRSRSREHSSVLFAQELLAKIRAFRERK